MSKNLRIAIPLILLLVAGYILYHLKQIGPVHRYAGTLVASDASMIMAPDGGVADSGDDEAGVLVVDTGVLDLDGASIPAPGDAGSPSKIPACGNCSFDLAAGLFRAQMQGKFTFE